MFASVGRSSFGVVLLAALAVLAACTMVPPNKAAGPAAAETEENTAQPALATYNCADGGMITIENLGSSIRILNGADEPIELPASPATQRSRFGETPYAIVLDGREALYMKSGDEPLTCTR